MTLELKAHFCASRMFCRSHSSNSFLVARFGINFAASSGWIGVLPGTELRSEIGLIFPLAVSLFPLQLSGQHLRSPGSQGPWCAPLLARPLSHDLVFFAPGSFPGVYDVAPRVL